MFCLGAANKVVNKIKQDKNKVKRLEVETPLAACLDLPGNGARNLCLMRVDVHVRWKPQEEGMMHTTVSFPQYETKVIEPVGAKKHVKVVGGGM